MVDRQITNSDCLEGMEEEFSQRLNDAGYEEGLELGKKHGEEEGYSHGLIEGAKKGSEVGFYRGFAMTWIGLLQSNSDQTNKSTKSLNRLQETLDLVDAYPKTNDDLCQEKLIDLRMKFKQSISLLNLKINNTHSSLI